MSSGNFEVSRFTVPEELHESTKELVASFAEALAMKLFKAQKKYGYTDGWADPDWAEDCRLDFQHHVEKGDPLDVAAYAAFLWYHNESTNKKET